ncbi:MAG: tetratricopeptide repeat protein [Cyclobacteriaceae bacterium]
MAQSYYETGESFYNRRGENAIGLVADKKLINTALKNYKKAKKTPQTIAAIMRAYEYKASYTELSKKKRKGIYRLAIKMGKQALQKYPDHVSIKYYYMANLGRWGQSVSLIKAHKKGVVDQVREITSEIMKADSVFDESGSQRILGAIHLKAPNIPLVLTWPSDEIALQLLGSAYRLSPDNVGNCKLYAEALLELDRNNEAKSVLQEIVQRAPRKSRFVEDSKNIDEAKRLLDSSFSGA